MKNIKNPKPLCLITALIIILSAFVFSSTAAEEKPLTNTVTEVTAVNAVDNDNITAADGYDHGYVPTISAFNAFDLRKGVTVQGKKIILIDDVFTTGTTLLSCARVLHQHGAQEIVSCTLASGQARF